jgi:hypothetical protein
MGLRVLQRTGNRVPTGYDWPSIPWRFRGIMTRADLRRGYNRPGRTLAASWSASRIHLARMRGRTAPAKMAIVRHTALNLPPGAKPTTNFKNRRKKPKWDVDYLEAVP